MRGEIKGLHQRLNTTTVYVTHDQVEAMTMADKIVVMNAGRVEQIGTSIELFDRPANLFVAGFIGSPAMNFISGEIEEGGFRAAGGILLPVPLRPPANSSAIYGVRPEHFEIGEGGLPVTVSLVEPMGSDTQITGTFGDTEIIAMFHRRVPASPGDVLPLRPVTAETHLFDASTGMRLQ
jgi:multiple sugar transport system ATP-binding protein